MKPKFYIHQNITLLKYLHMRIIFLYDNKLLYVSYDG